MKFTFGDIVVVDSNLIGVIVKCWQKSLSGKKSAHYEVYVRNYNSIQEYNENEIQRYLVRHKELNDEEMYYQKKAGE